MLPTIEMDLIKKKLIMYDIIERKVDILRDIFRIEAYEYGHIPIEDCKALLTVRGEGGILYRKRYVNGLTDWLQLKPEAVNILLKRADDEVKNIAYSGVEVVMYLIIE